MKELLNFPDYCATECGKIWSKKSKKFLSTKTKSKGYCKVNLYDGNGNVKNVRVHRIIWEAFNGEIPDGYEINHKNEIRDDNKLSNLELVTHYDNLMYGSRKEKQRNSLKKVVKRGGDCNFSKPITLFDLESGETFKFSSRVEAAKKFGLEKSQFTYLIKKSKSNGGFIIVGDKTLKIL